MNDGPKQKFPRFCSCSYVFNHVLFCFFVAILYTNIPLCNTISLLHRASRDSRVADREPLFSSCPSPLQTPNLQFRTRLQFAPHTDLQNVVFSESTVCGKFQILGQFLGNGQQKQLFLIFSLVAKYLDFFTHN